MIIQNKKSQRIYIPIINEAQDIYMSLNLSNPDDLSVPIQLLAKAIYNLSVIHDERLHIAIDSLHDNGQIAQFTATVNTELQQIRIVFLSYKNNLKKLAESLPHMAFDRLRKRTTILFLQYSQIGGVPCIITRRT